MGGSSFELIMQEVLGQKQRMDDLLAENRELYRQLTDLREGRGIFLEIQGKRFALDGTPADDYLPPVASTAQDSSISYQPTIVMPVSKATMDTPGTLPETPLPSDIETFEPIPYYLDSVEEHEEEEPTHTPSSFLEETHTSSSFLEEMLIDEFASVATSPLAVWKAPDPNTSSITRKLNIDEEQKAVLRKELIGSFLLE